MVPHIFFVNSNITLYWKSSIVNVIHHTALLLKVLSNSSCICQSSVHKLISSYGNIFALKKCLLMFNFGYPVFGHQDNLNHMKRSPKVVVISYTMLSRLRRSMLEQKWALLIVDESHNIRCTKKKSESVEVFHF